MRNNPDELRKRLNLKKERRASQPGLHLPEPPVIKEIRPAVIKPGDEITIWGHLFDHNATILLGEHSFKPKLKEIEENDNTIRNVLNDAIPDWQFFTVKVPDDILHGGEVDVEVDNPDGGWSLAHKIRVLPVIREIQQYGQATDKIDPFNTVRLIACGLEPEIAVFFDQTELVFSRPEYNRIEFSIPRINLDDGTTKHSISILNKVAGDTSDLYRFKFIPFRDSGFRVLKNGFGFKNFSAGWSGPDEFKKSYLPVLPWQVFWPDYVAFYNTFIGAYHAYLNGGAAAHCHAMSCLSLRYFLSGEKPELHSETENMDFQVLANPPDLDEVSKEFLSHLDWIQGRLLSDEMLLYFLTYMKDIDSPEPAVKAFESFVDKDGVSPDEGVIFSFIPKSLSEVSYDRLCLTHSVVPTRIVYENGYGNLDGAKVFVYNSNLEENENEFIRIFSQDGVFKFSFSEGARTYSTDEGYLLAFSLTEMGSDSKKHSVPYYFSKLFGLGVLGI